MPRAMLSWCLPIALALSASACGSTSTSSTTAITPTGPTPTPVTESFSGSISQSGTAAYPFTVSTAGSVQIGLTSVAPLATMALGVSFGSWNGTTCGTKIAENDNARSGATALSGIAAAAGSYCVQVFDSGNIPDTWSVSYTVQVTHP